MYVVYEAIRLKQVVIQWEAFLYCLICFILSIVYEIVFWIIKLHEIITLNSFVTLHKIYKKLLQWWQLSLICTYYIFSLPLNQQFILRWVLQSAIKNFLWILHIMTSKFIWWNANIQPRLTEKKDRTLN